MKSTRTFYKCENCYKEIPSTDTVTEVRELKQHTDTDTMAVLSEKHYCPFCVSLYYRPVKRHSD